MINKLQTKIQISTSSNHISTIMNFISVIVMLTAIVRIDCRSTDLTPPERLTIESNSIQRLFTEKSHTTVIDPSRSLKRAFLSNRTVTCNDGSQAGFYLRKSLKSKRWVVFFEGGWHCYDTKSCRTRWLRLRHLMTSAQWPETRDVGGILSPIESDNPYWHDANHVLVPYCSSDSWSGTKALPEVRDGWSFMGSLIVRQVIADLIPLGLGRSQGGELLLAGSSAGGLGVMLNLDKVKRFLRNERGIKITVRGVSDSGWFLDRDPYVPTAIAAADVVKLGYKMWGGDLPQACTAKHPNEPWRCYFGHRLYPTLTSPLFVFQWLFDEAQMRADSIEAPVTKEQWNHIHEMGGALRSSLDNVTAVFAPSCIGHAVLTKRDWMDIRIDDISLAEALRCWERATGKQQNKSRRAFDSNQNRPKNHRRKNAETVVTTFHRDVDGGGGGGNGDGNDDFQTADKMPSRMAYGNYSTVMLRHGRHHHRLTKEERIRRRQNMTKEEREQRRQNRIRRRQKNAFLDKIKQQIDRPNRKKSNSNQHAPDLRRTPAHHAVNNHHHHHHQQHNNNNNSPHNNERRRNNENKRKKRRNNHKNHDNRRMSQHRKKFAEPERCSLRLLERCSWPQCNHSCPALTNPLTGEEVRFLELLSSFGLDIEAVATALGIDMQTLNNMDQAELVNLLTQQVS